MKSKILIFPVLFFLFLTFSSSVSKTNKDVLVKEGSASVKIFKRYTILYQSPEWTDAGGCRHWYNVSVSFDWVPGTNPTNINVNSVTEIIRCPKVPDVLTMRYINSISFDNNAHVTALIFAPTGDPETDAKLNDPAYLALFINGFNIVIEASK